MLRSFVETLLGEQTLVQIIRRDFYVFAMAVVEYLQNDGVTTGDELDDAAGFFEIDNWGGVYSRNTQAYGGGTNYIVNDDLLGMEGSHWVAVTCDGYTYDPLRPSGADLDAEQHPETDLCGQYALAFLMTAKKFPEEYDLI